MDAPLPIQTHDSPNLRSLRVSCNSSLKIGETLPRGICKITEEDEMSPES